MTGNKKKSSSIKKVFWSLFAFFIVFIMVAGFFLYQHIIQGLPSLEQLENPKPRLSSKVYSQEGKLVHQFFRQNRIETKLDSVPDRVIDALIATEDRKFFDHWGVDLERFAKAMIKSLIFFKREGGSTITQQLAKNLYELKTYDENLFETGIRKIREWITAVQIERQYTKEEILTMYLNISYFGHGAYGIQMASKV